MILEIQFTSKIVGGRGPNRRPHLTAHEKNKGERRRRRQWLAPQERGEGVDPAERVQGQHERSQENVNGEEDGHWGSSSAAGGRWVRHCSDWNEGAELYRRRVDQRSMVSGR